MLTIGVDLAAADVRTAMASIEWAEGRAVVRSVQFGVSDGDILAAVDGAVFEAAGRAFSGAAGGAFSGAAGGAFSGAAGGAFSGAAGGAVSEAAGGTVPGAAGGAITGAAHDAVDGAVGAAGFGLAETAVKVGIDCPLGWPAAFVRFMVEQEAGRLAAVEHDDPAMWRRGLAYRVTDEVVRKETGLIPLSVSADRIAHAAFRCAGLLARLPGPVDRTGDGLVAEVYPAASLRRWGLTHRGYKSDGHAFLVDELVAAAPWLELGEHRPLLTASHDAFDAVVAALAARAAAVGQTLRPDAAQRPAAATEGWIALPTGKLSDLPL